MIMPYCALLLALLLIGCGQKGPLYLPTKAPAPLASSPQTVEPQDQKLKDENQQDKEKSQPTTSSSTPAVQL